jgi:hypothetical protein
MDDIDEVLQQVEAAALRLGWSREIAMTDKVAELEQRFHLLCMPNDRLRPAQIIDYLVEVTGLPRDQISDEFVERVTKSQRRLKLTDEQYLGLEAAQNYRCRLCGTYLTRHVRPHVDHIVPIALGGGDALGNLQLLCALCNQGKSDYVDWRLAVRYNRAGLTPAVRYSVLSRFNASCQWEACAGTSATDHLQVVLRVPEGRGGRAIFDNLWALCSSHAAERLRIQRHRTLVELRGIQYGITSLSR